MTNNIHAEDDLSFLERLPLDARRLFRTISSRRHYETGAILFGAGHEAKGVFLLCKGKVKLTASSGKGKTLALRIAWPGEVLGLSAAITGNPYEMTALAIDPSEAEFVSRGDFLHFLNSHPEACFQAVQILSREICTIEDRVGFFRAGRLASGRLARLLLAWCDEGIETDEGIRLTVPLTEREIGQMIGTTRETTARLLGKLKDEGIAQRVGHGFLIHDKSALERITRTHPNRSVFA